MSSSEPRRIALADPHDSFPTRFAVGGQSTQTGSGDVKVYEWDPESGQMGMVGLQTDVGQIRAMAWSSHPTHRSLVATGLSTGKTHILSLSPATLSFPLSPSSSIAPPSIISTPSSAIASLTVKYSRPITSISFSDLDSNYLATGLERHRSDYSLFIWDISDVLSRSTPDTTGTNWTRPNDRLDILNPTFLIQPPPKPSEPRHIQQYCQSETVNSVSFIPGTIDKIVASSNNKQIRLFDLRLPSITSNQNNSPTPTHRDSSLAGAASLWYTAAVHSIKPEPLCPNLFASYETVQTGTTGHRQSVVRIWDLRKIGSELLSFDVGGGGVVELDWVKGVKGRLGVGSRDGGIGIWDIISGTRLSDDGSFGEEWATISGMRHVVKSKQALHSFALAPSNSGTQGDILFVVKDGTINVGPITAPPIIASSPLGDIAVASTPSLTIIDPESTHSQHPQPYHHSHRDHNITLREITPKLIEEEHEPRKNRFQLAPEGVSRLLEEHGSRPKSRSISPVGSQVLKGLDGVSLRREAVGEEHEEEERDVEGGDDGNRSWKRALGTDVGYIMRRRAEDGYGLDDLLVNAAIATKYPGRARLAGVWEFVHHFIQTMSPSTSQHRSYNLTHCGIYQIWTGIFDTSAHQSLASPNPSMRSQSTITTPFQNPQPQTQIQTSSAWTALRNQSHNQNQSQQHTPQPSKSNTPSLHAPMRGVSQRRAGMVVDMPLVDPEYDAAVARINAVRLEGEHVGAPGNHKLPPTEKAAQRRMILGICGENHRKGGSVEIDRLIDDDQRTKAACWAYFAGDEGQAIKILLNSDDEKHRLMASTIAGSIGQAKSERGSVFWNENWRAMIRNMDDRYIRAILTRVAGEEWEEVLDDEVLPLLDRVAIAVCNLDDKDLTQWLSKQLNISHSQGNLQSLALTGFTSLSLPLLSQYLSRTQDIQTVAILASFIAPGKLPTSRDTWMVERWQEEYRDLMDRWKAFLERCRFDVGRIEERRKLGDDGWGEKLVPIQTLVVCPVCHNLLTKQTEEHLYRKGALRGTITQTTVRTNICLYCNNALPRCVICLLHVLPHNLEPTDSYGEKNDIVEDTIDSAYVCCQTCRHGGHANHILPWFQGGLDGEPAHRVCAVSGCKCECASI